MYIYIYIYNCYHLYTDVYIHTYINMHLLPEVAEGEHAVVELGLDRVHRLLLFMFCLFVYCLVYY